ncbi:DUF1302 family protein [Algiphilus sp.]|uniref:DUF1302 domain-containing protein n=1 Tax=Algiphilus sp. TaxID=1872431 RepID=UPI0025B9F7A0|nr:DUF1302 family protein [Algiphilus sp.]MCK5768826.1 DUF1302 family protein [Algiphilus sp.]
MKRACRPDPQSGNAVAPPSAPAARALAFAALAGCAVSAQAIEFGYGSGERAVTIDWQNTLSLGGAVRTEARDPRLVGKLSLPGNRDLCAPDDCIGLSRGATEPNERFLAAPGGLSANIDDGNLNYDRGDLVAATAKWSSELFAEWSFGGLELSGFYFYDPINTGFDQDYRNIKLDPGPGPGVRARIERPDEVEEDVGHNWVLRNANVYFDVPLPGDREARVRIGRQLNDWGTGTVVIRGGLNFANPASASAVGIPGAELFELFQPAGMVSVRTALDDQWSLEGFYQYEFVPVKIQARGSYLSFLDAGNRVAPGDHFPLPFGKTPHDPNQLQTPADGLLGLVSDTSFAALRGPNEYPDDGGQFALAAFYFLPDLGPAGTEFGFYAANFHSRVPSASAIAADASCTRREGNANNNDTSNLVEFLADCGIPGVATPGEDIEALPIDTAKVFLEYPEDTHMLGFSFSTELFSTLFEGEINWRPNEPVQVDLEDVLFAAFQPVFPRESVVILPDILEPAAPLLDLVPSIPGLPIQLADLGPATLADSEIAIPDYLTAYRGGVPGEVVPGSRIRGYERLTQWQGSLSALRILGPDRVLGSDQFAVLAEATAVYLPGLPGRDVLQFEAPGTNTHASPGIRETGNGLLINPVQETGRYVTSFSWGIRAFFFLLYNDVAMPGLQLRPAFTVVHDVKGVSPGLAENFLQGRTFLVGNLEAQYGRWSLNLGYADFSGAGTQNTVGDRSFANFAISYAF